MDYTQFIVDSLIRGVIVGFCFKSIKTAIQDQILDTLWIGNKPVYIFTEVTPSKLEEGVTPEDIKSACKRIEKEFKEEKDTVSCKNCKEE